VLYLLSESVLTWIFFFIRENGGQLLPQLSEDGVSKNGHEIFPQNKLSGSREKPKKDCFE
jgi:hypothetical protein